MATSPTVKRRVLIVVRTYPTPAKTGVEVSCTAAITEKQEWLRLFPIPYRFLPTEKRFKKYQWIEVLLRKAKDKRPESFNLDLDSIKLLTPPMPTTNGWEKRRNLLLPLRNSSLCELQETRDQNGFPTLGLIRPRKIKRLIIKPTTPQWSAAQLAILRQENLFQKMPTEELEKVPYDFSYEFTCEHPECQGHGMICTDWEMGESWRKWSAEYGDEWESKFRQKYEDEMINKYDTHFYVGTIHQHPGSWIIVGLFYPPRVAQRSSPGLFDAQ